MINNVIWVGREDTANPDGMKKAGPIKRDFLGETTSKLNPELGQRWEPDVKEGDIKSRVGW